MSTLPSPRLQQQLRQQRRLQREQRDPYAAERKELLPRQDQPRRNLNRTGEAQQRDSQNQ